MTAFVVFASGTVDMSIINCLGARGAPDLIGYSRNVEDAVVPIMEDTPEIVIVDSRHAESKAVSLLHGLWGFALVPVIIVLMGMELKENDQEWVRHKGVYYFSYPQQRGDLLAVLLKCANTKQDLLGRVSLNDARKMTVQSNAPGSDHSIHRN